MRLCLATIAMLLARGLALVPAKSLPLRSCARSPAPRSQTTRMVVGWSIVTAAKTVAALPDFVQQKPRIVQGAGMLNGLVYGVDADGDWHFSASGERPAKDKDPEEAQD